MNRLVNSIIILLLIVYLSLIRSDCVIQYPSDIDTAPRYEKPIGKFKLRIPYNTNPIKLKENESLHGYCATYFKSIEYQPKKVIPYYNSNFNNYRSTQQEIEVKPISKLTSIVLNCRDDNLFYDTFKVSNNVFTCINREWSIYSSKKPYSWCTNNQNSSTFYLTDSGTSDNNILAAVCFNMEQISLQTVAYNTTHLRRHFLKPPMDQPISPPPPSAISSEDLDENLWNFKTTALSDINEKLLQETLSELAQKYKWLNMANYEISSIVQDESLKKYFDEFKNVLNIIWWRNLRLGNWRRFMDTLAKYAHNNSFELFTGTSGVAEYPTDEKCIKEKRLELNIGFKNETIPSYIWTYLKSLDQINKDFIIVGYNSPYSEYFTIEKVKFCPDICSDIPWLAEIYPAFRYNFGGIMFCCSTDFIKQTNYLQGFPLELLGAATIVGTTTPSALYNNDTTSY